MNHHTTAHLIPEIFVAGIDGSGKTAVLSLLITRLSAKYRILTNQDGLCLHYRGENTRILKHSWFKATYWLKSSSNRRMRGLLSLLTFTARQLESKYLKRHGKIDLIVFETDTVLHPAAFSALHFPWIKRVNGRLRFRIFNGLFGPRKNFVTFYLETDSHIALERILKRDTAADPHENIIDLEILRNEFDHMVNIAAKFNIQIDRIDTNLRTVESTVNEMERILKEKLAVGL